MRVRTETIDDPGLTTYADALSRCLADALACAEACEAHLATLPEGSEELRSALDLLAPPAAVSRILAELPDRPPQLVVAAARLCRELTSAAADAVDHDAAPVDALRTAADSCARLVAVAAAG